MEQNIELGEYCLATKGDDGEAWDHWAVGFYGGRTEHGRHILVDDIGNRIRYSGFRRCAKVSRAFGEYLLKNAKELESAGTKLWDLLDSGLNTESKGVGHEFYAIMVKRRDGKVYADLAKTTQFIYLDRENAERDLPGYPGHHVVKLIAYVEG